MVRSLRKESEGDGSHDSIAVEDSGLQGQLRTTEVGRGDKRNGNLDVLDKGGGLQTSEGKHQKGFDERTKVGDGRWQRMALDPTSGHWETKTSG